MIANIMDRELLRSWLNLKLFFRLGAHGQRNAIIFFWMDYPNQSINKYLLSIYYVLSPMLGMSLNIQGIQESMSSGNVYY